MLGNTTADVGEGVIEPVNPSVLKVLDEQLNANQQKIDRDGQYDRVNVHGYVVKQVTM